MKNFNNKIVVITGAGSGMGRAYAEAFGKLGAKLALCDYNAETLQETANRLIKQGVEHVFTQAVDVSDKSAVYTFADAVQQTLGNAHIIINNAGIEGANEPVFSTDESSYERVLGVNFFGVLYGTKAFLPQIVANDEGAIVNISSVFGLVGVPSNGEYCASKFAVRGFTEALMAEFHTHPSISIHCVHPGGIDTNICADDSSQAFSKKYLTTPPEEMVNRVIQAIKQKRAKVVYGNNSRLTWLGATFVPQQWLKGILWGQLKQVINLSSYDRFLKKP